MSKSRSAALTASNSKTAPLARNSTRSAPLTATASLSAGQAANAASIAGGARPTVVQLAIKERIALYQAYIPLFAEGGIFVPTTRECKLGDDLFVLLTLPEDTQRYAVAGKVAWITPARAQGNRSQGVGVQFPKDEKARHLKLKIEQLLGANLGSDKPTQTI